MKFSREWAMPNSRTFQIKPIKGFVERNLENRAVIIDPFANECKYGTITNDLSPDTARIITWRSGLSKELADELRRCNLRPHILCDRCQRYKALELPNDRNPQHVR